MGLYRDERGQAIQVGAAILLGFVVIAMTIYQVQVVPSQNGEIEFDHNQGVQEDLQELRNAIVNAGSEERTESVSIDLGTRYPARTFFVNPPPARGVLRTEELGNVTFENAAVQGSYDGNATALVAEEHPTVQLSYVPHYSEYRDPPTTVYEHSLLYNALDTGHVSPVTRQRVVRGDELHLVFLQGNLSEQGTDAVSLEADTVEGPTDEVTVEPDGSGPIRLYLPTETPDAWNETIGTSVDDGVANATVVAYHPARGEVEVELHEEAYELRMALVGVGDEVEEPGRYDVSERSGSGGGGNGSYDLFWQGPSSDGVAPDCDAESCTWDAGASDDTMDLTAQVDPRFEGIDVEYASENSSVATVDPDSGQTGPDGTNVTTLEAQDNGTIDVLASANDDSAVIEVVVTNVSDGGDGGGGGQVLQPVESDGVNGGTQLTFTVENTGSDSVTVTDFSIDVTTTNNVRIDNGDSPELEILRATQNGEANRNPPGNERRYDADGTVYDLVADSTMGGQYAILESDDDDATVDFRGFDNDFGDLEFADSTANADIIVTLQLEDGTVQEFYFREV